MSWLNHTPAAQSIHVLQGSRCKISRAPLLAESGEGHSVSSTSPWPTVTCPWAPESATSWEGPPIPSTCTHPGTCKLAMFPGWCPSTCPALHQLGFPSLPHPALCPGRLATPSSLLPFGHRLGPARVRCRQEIRGWETGGDGFSSPSVSALAPRSGSGAIPLPR